MQNKKPSKKTEKQDTKQTRSVPAIKKKSSRRAGTVQFPHNSIRDALRVTNSIWGDNAGHPFPIGDLANKLEYSPTSTNFIDLVRSANRYGLIESSWVQDVTKTIALSPLGLSISAPKTGEDITAKMLTALKTPKVFQNFS